MTEFKIRVLLAPDRVDETTLGEWLEARGYIYYMPAMAASAVQIEIHFADSAAAAACAREFAGVVTSLPGPD